MATVREITTLFNFKPQLGGLKKSIINVDKLKAALKAVGIATAALGGAIFAIAKTTANFGDNIAKTAQKIGLTTDALQELTFASGLAGVNQATLEGAIKRLSRGMLEASQGVAEYADTYKDLDIDVEDANGKLKASDVILEELADKLGAMEDGTKKTALAQELFGRAGAELIPLLNEGSKGIRKMRKEARDLGLVMSKKATKSSEAFNDELFRTGEVIKAIKRDIGIFLLPIIQKLVKEFRNWVVQNRELIRENIPKFIDKAAFALGFLIGVIQGVVIRFNEFVDALKAGKAWAIILFETLKAFSPIGLLERLTIQVKVLLGVFDSLGKAFDFLKRIPVPKILGAGIIKSLSKLFSSTPSIGVSASLTPTKGASSSSGSTNVINVGTIKVDASSVKNPEKVGEMVKEKIENISIKLRNRVVPQMESLGRV